jgi:lipopolysaccharide biosynthesis protein
MTRVRSFAFYLPQFHRIEENDQWWGPGFTEWTQVRAARPRFRGHSQPVRPGELGYYDLLDPSVQRAQAELAARYGIEGFVYYHYWFSGRRLLERPLDAVLKSGAPDLPFCLCWANENWTRRWDGGDDQVLIAQRYASGDAEAFARDLLPYIADARYIRFEGRPVLLVHRASRIPDPAHTTDVWRAVVSGAGLGDLYLLRVEHLADEHGDPRCHGFDGAVDFQPHFAQLPGERWTRTMRRRLRLTNREAPAVIDYERVVDAMLARASPPYARWPGVTPGWDNTPRRAQGGLVIRGATPDLYQRWVRALVERAKANNTKEVLIFVNAWNEWSEGAHLEPDAATGRR